MTLGGELSKSTPGDYVRPLARLYILILPKRYQLVIQMPDNVGDISLKPPQSPYLSMISLWLSRQNDIPGRIKLTAFLVQTGHS